jgi:PIN domain nuclease of toxin-antitoxin system
MATQVRLGRLPATADITRNFDEYLEQSEFETCRSAPSTAFALVFFQGPQRDPFDRMLIAQAQAEDLTLVSNELVFDSYGISRIW